MEIVILDGYSANPGDLSWEGLSEFGELTVYPRTLPEEILERASSAELILTNKVVLSAEILKSLEKLRYIGVLATGYNVVDMETARQRGIVVTHIPAYSTASVAQMTFAHILNITNRVGHYALQNRQGHWGRQEDFCYWDTPLCELTGKILGIIGLGNIGMKVARIACEFGMKVIAMTQKQPEDLPDGISKVSQNHLLSDSDIVSLHCPLTPSTRHLINEETLQKMKEGAILINTSRGPLVDERAVSVALQSGRLAAYGADVLEIEPPLADHLLLRQPHAFITPHIAWATLESRRRLIEVAVANVREFVKGTPQNVV